MITSEFHEFDNLRIKLSFSVFFLVLFYSSSFFLMSLPLPHLKKPRCYMCTVPRSSTARYEKSLGRRTVPKHAVAYSFVLFINKNHMQIHRFDTDVDI